MSNKRTLGVFGPVGKLTYCPNHYVLYASPHILYTKRLKKTTKVMYRNNSIASTVITESDYTEDVKSNKEILHPTFTGNILSHLSHIITS